jgi:L-iditol 2-dehydrogenase
VGDRVTTETFAHFCGSCFFCKRAKPNLCPERRSIGTHLNGMFARYLTIRASAVHRLPEEVSFWAGALSEPLACCVHGILERTPITAGDWVVISGPGTIGLLSLQLVKADGGKAIVLGTDKDEERLALAKKLGADETINVGRQDPLPLLQERTGGLGADLAIECAGVAASFNQCLKLTRKGGRISQGGLFGKPISSDLELIAMKELGVFGFFSHVPSAWDRALQLMAEGKVLTEPLISHRLPLSEWQKGFTLMEHGEGLKVLLLP